MAAVEGAQLEAGLRGGLLVLGARPVELVDVGGGDGDEAGELELGVAGDELGLAFEHGGLGAAVAGADAEPGAGALLLVGGEPGGVPVDPPLRPGRRHRLVVDGEGRGPAGVEEQRLQPAGPTSSRGHSATQ